MTNSVRDVMKDRIRDLLGEYLDHTKKGFDRNELVCDIADEAFSVCGISEQEQDEEW